MNQAIIFFLGFISLVAALDKSTSPIMIPPKTVDSLNINAFMGRWIQMYSSWIPVNTYQKDQYCMIADFTSSGQPKGGLRAETDVTFDILFSSK